MIPLIGFLSEIALQEGIKAEEILAGDVGEKQAVTLTTVHRAKGLEWKVVFIIWAAEEIFPYPEATEMKPQWKRSAGSFMLQQQGQRQTFIFPIRFSQQDIMSEM